MREPEQVAQKRERTIDRRRAESALCGSFALTYRADLRTPGRLVLAYPARSDIRQRRVRPEVAREMAENAPVFADRALPRLRAEVLLDRLSECDAVRLRLLGLDPQQRLG